MGVHCAGGRGGANSKYAMPREKGSFTGVTVTASRRDLDHDSRWSTYEENVRKLPRFPSGGS